MSYTYLSKWPHGKYLKSELSPNEEEVSGKYQIIDNDQPPRELAQYLLRGRSSLIPRDHWIAMA
jgi:hypothetical protein